MTASLDSDRLASIQRTLNLWSQRTEASRADLDSLVGTLNFCAKVVRAGRTFLRRLIDHKTSLMNCPPKLARKLSPGARADIRWWQSYVSQWNGTGLLYEREWTTSADMQLELFTDASTPGYGAVFGRRWIYGQWPEDVEAAATRVKRDSMPYKELWSILAAAATWGSHWQRQRILISLTVSRLSMLSTAARQNAGLMTLIRTLAWIAAQHQFEYRLTHIAGVTNVLADALSRLDVDAFRQACPDAHPSPDTRVPMPDRIW